MSGSGPTGLLGSGMANPDISSVIETPFGSALEERYLDLIGSPRDGEEAE